MKGGSERRSIPVANILWIALALALVDLALGLAQVETVPLDVLTASGLAALGLCLLLITLVWALSGPPLRERITSTPARRVAMGSAALLAAACAVTILIRGHVSHWRPPVEPQGVRSESAIAEHAPDVVLITIDTLRHDSVSCHPGSLVRTPAIESLCADGIVYPNAYSPAPWTFPALSSLLTGFSPAVHQATRKTSKLPESLQTLAMLLRDGGYATRAVVSNQNLDPVRGLGRGFERYDAFPRPWRRFRNAGHGLVSSFGGSRFAVNADARRISDLGIDWLQTRAESPFFLWLHYLDPHWPYEPLPGRRIAVRPTWDSLWGVRRGEIELTAEEREEWRALYRAEIEAVDRQVGRVLETLRDLGLYDRSLIVLTSDHGEEFWEHDGFEHGHTVYDELLRVPLIVKPPGGAGEPSTQDARVSISSVFGTVLDHAGLGSPAGRAAPLPAPSELALVAPGELLATGTLYGRRETALLFDRYKAIFLGRDNEMLLFDLIDDPDERSSLTSSRVDLADEARRRLAEALLRYEATRETLGLKEESLSDQASERLLEDLRSLGYVE